MNFSPNNPIRDSNDIGICLFNNPVGCGLIEAVFVKVKSLEIYVYMHWKGNSLVNTYFIVVVEFFNRINLIYGTVCEYCTKETCPKMSGGPK